MSIPDRALDVIADAWVENFPYVAIFTDSAGTGGDHEASGGAYKRKKPDWSSSSSGKAKGSEVAIDVEAGSYKEGGLYSSESGGDFGGSAEFSDGEIEVSGKGAKIKVKPQVRINS